MKKGKEEGKGKSRSKSTRVSAVVLVAFAFAIFMVAPAIAGTVTYDYDDAGRLVKADYGNGSAIEYEYDNAGNMLEKKNLLGVETSTGTGSASFETDEGEMKGLTAEDGTTLPKEGKPNLEFKQGFFSFNITGLAPGQTVNVTITLPDNAPVGTEYWKYHASEGGWIQIPMGSNDGDNEITITLVDGGLGDDDGIADGKIVDQGGPGNPPHGPGPIPVPEFSIFGLLVLIGVVVVVLAAIMVLRREK